jgi:hypothetical protein
VFCDCWFKISPLILLLTKLLQLDLDRLREISQWFSLKKAEKSWADPTIYSHRATPYVVTSEAPGTLQEVKIWEFLPRINYCAKSRGYRAEKDMLLSLLS